MFACLCPCACLYGTEFSIVRVIKDERKKKGINNPLIFAIRENGTDICISLYVHLG